VSQPEDRATLESDPSAALEAEKRRGFKAPAAREFRGESERSWREGVKLNTASDPDSSVLLSLPFVHPL
jgi:hypothetical protein